MDSIVISHVRSEDLAVQTNEVHQQGVARLAAQFAALLTFILLLFLL